MVKWIPRGRYTENKAGSHPKVERGHRLPICKLGSHYDREFQSPVEGSYDDIRMYLKNAVPVDNLSEYVGSSFGV